MPYEGITPKQEESQNLTILWRRTSLLAALLLYKN